MAARRGQAEYFEIVRSQLATEPAVRAVRVDARTANVLLLLHVPADTAALLGRAAQQGLFALVSTNAGGEHDGGELPAPLRAFG